MIHLQNIVFFFLNISVYQGSLAAPVFSFLIIWRCISQQRKTLSLHGRHLLIGIMLVVGALIRSYLYFVGHSPPKIDKTSYLDIIMNMYIYICVYTYGYIYICIYIYA